jgi:hypothetical protein
VGILAARTVGKGNLDHEKKSGDNNKKRGLQPRFSWEFGELVARLRGLYGAVKRSGVVRGVITRVPFSLLWFGS